MEVNELINLMINNCFPVVLSAYLLIRLEKQLSSLAGSINKLNSIICAKLGAVISTDAKNSISDEQKGLLLFSFLVYFIIVKFFAFRSL